MKSCPASGNQTGAEGTSPSAPIAVTWYPAGPAGNCARTVPASLVPDGDLDISVLIGSGTSNDVEEARAGLNARVPFSGTAVGAGKGRYRVDLALAPSRRPACGRARCTGATVTVTVGGHAWSTRLDSRGHAVVVVTAGAKHGKITVGVTMSGAARLTDRALAVPVG